MGAQRFEELVVWQKGHQYALGAYKITRVWPREELFGLTSQLRRAAVSVPANIAEGFRRRTAPDKARCLNIAEASLEESRYYLLLARDLHYATDPALEPLATEVSKLLTAYIRAIRAR